VGGGAVAYGALQVDEERKKGCTVELNNSLLNRVPATLSKEEVAALDSAYGVEMARDFTQDLKNMYDHYLTSVMPPGDVPLGGWEAEALSSFKEALGLEDADAAEVHIEVGRRIFRMRSEMGTRDAEAQERMAFQKLVFLSSLIFGEAKARYLLPWKRLFNVSDAQVLHARKTNGAMMYKKYLNSFPEPLSPDADMFTKARDYQTRMGLEEETASEIVQELCRDRVENRVEAASEVLKASGRTRSKDVTGAVSALHEVLAYNAAMTQLKESAEASNLAPGVGPVTLWGGRIHSANRTDDLVSLYRMFLAEGIKDGTFTEKQLAELKSLQKLFGLGSKEADAVTMDVQTKVYRNALRRAVSSGSLEAAESKAVFLTDMCEKLRFPGDAAAGVHSEIYKQKLDSMLEKKRLTDEDEKELVKMRVLLCIPESTVKEAHKERCGAIFRATLEKALQSGIDGFSTQLMNMVVKCAKDLRMDQDLAVDLLSTSVKKVFQSCIKTAKGKSTRLEQAKELKKMVFFSNLVVSPLLKALKPPTKEELERERAQEEIQKIMKEAQEMTDKEDAEEKAKAEGKDAKTKNKEEKAEGKEDKGDSLSKTAAAVSTALGGETMTLDGKQVKVQSQKVITMAEEMELRDRTELYRNYLLYCMSGDQVDLPMGSTVQIERDQTEFLRLAQLGDILGLTSKDVQDVHTGLSEKAFQTNVQQALGDGQLTKERSAYLKDLQGQLGLTDEAAQTIIRGVMSQQLGSNVKAQVSQGKMTLAEVRKLKAQNVDVQDMLSADVRAGLFRKECESLLSAGTGIFNEEEMTKNLPKLLALDEKKTTAIIKEVTKERKRDALVSAVAQNRQHDPELAFKSLNNLLACHAAQPDLPVSWPVQEELQDLYSLYLFKGGSNKEDLKTVLKLSDETAAELESVVSTGGWKIEEEDEDEPLF